MSLKLEELKKISDEELIVLYDETADSTLVGLNYYTEELSRRSNEKTNKIMIKCTVWITVMTGVMLFTAIANIVITLLIYD